jgi:hypothetical protein
MKFVQQELPISNFVTTGQRTRYTVDPSRKGEYCTITAELTETQINCNSIKYSVLRLVLQIDVRIVLKWIIKK